jgi:methionyl-tRNA formyltransferase
VGGLRPPPQPADGVSYAPKLTQEDARVRWNTPAHAVGRWIRACTPAPGAWTVFGDTRLKLGPVRAGPPDQGTPASGPPPALSPGELWVGKAAVFAGTATRPVELGDVQPPGKRRLSAAEWARGLRLEPAGAGRVPLVFS